MLFMKVLHKWSWWTWMVTPLCTGLRWEGTLRFARY